MRGRRPGPALVLVLAIALGGLTACSHVDFAWSRPGLSPQSPAAIKRLAVWAQADSHSQPGLAATLTQMAAEYAKLRRNYLVLSTHQQAGSVKEVCGERVEGVLWLQALDAAVEGEDASLTLRAELWSCRGPQLMWSVQGHRRGRQHDPNLRQLTESYQAEVGTTAATWAAPSFVLLQELLGRLPDPHLSDADIEEKLELGWALESISEGSQPL